VRVPGQTKPGVRVKGMFQHFDIAPTVCEILEREAAPQFDGRSLLAAARSEEDAGYDAVYACEASRMARWAIRTPKWKLIQVVDPGQYHLDFDELYHVADDPDETRNVIREHPEIADELALRLVRWRESQLGNRPDPVRVQMAGGSTMEASRRDGLEYMGMTFEEWIKYYQERFCEPGQA
jgi:choline-sulfatase